MNETMSANEFTEQVRTLVKSALPEELSNADVRIEKLKLWDGGARTALLIMRPCNGVTTGFCLDRQIKSYYDGSMTAESAAASIINDRRLYSIPAGNEGGAAFIYA
ncbi:MAG: hypothetical protein NC489_34860 [Ruminococcus flavefaciens]|nr:hypothetical protein [Ruminococcus flavefaciens]